MILSDINEVTVEWKENLRGTHHFSYCQNHDPIGPRGFIQLLKEILLMLDF